MASPALVAVSCGAATTTPASDGGTTTPTSTTTTTGTGARDATSPPVDGGPAPADSGADGASVDAAPDAGCLIQATLPPDDGCTRYRALRCDAVPEAGFFSQKECLALCPADSGTPAFCNVQKDAKNNAYLACMYCVIGRRPPGLVPVEAAEGTATGAYFADASHLEAASVEAFRLLREELASLGAPRSMLRRASRAEEDEVRHARMTASLARRFGAVPGEWAAAPRTEDRPARTLEEIALENATEGCVRETFGALTAMWQAEHARDRHVRAAMEAIAEDELRHAALAWSVASWSRARLDVAANLRVREAMRGEIERISRDVAAAPPAGVLVDQVGLPDAASTAVLLGSLDALLWDESRAAA